MKVVRKYRNTKHCLLVTLKEGEMRKPTMTKQTPHIVRPRVLKNAAKMGWIFTSGIQHKQLIKNSLFEKESRYVVLHNLALSKFYTHERSWRRGHGGKMYAHGDVFFFFFFFFFFCFFFAIWSRIFAPLCLSFPPFRFAFSWAFRMLGLWASLDWCWRGCITKVQR